ncbi:MAG: LuxR C-terminal-related transcriptional regulator [Dermatophilaceae bacterium]
MLLEQVAARVRRAIPYAVAGWLLVDPDTMLITGVYEEGVPREAHLELIALELSEPDVNKFVDLGRGPEAASALSAATGGDLGRSLRWSRVYEPAGFGDELRAVFRSGPVVWGHACLTRVADAAWFTPTEVETMARLSSHVAHGIRTALVLHEDDVTGEETPGLVVLDDDGTVRSASPQALTWLGPVEDDRLATSIVVHEVAAQARALADGSADASDGADRSSGPAVARVRSLSGEWLLVRGARLDETGTAVVVEPARRSDIAPLLLHLHDLTPRERQVTQRLLTGLGTAEIARDLWITEDTLRGHIKSIFAKLAVNSRPELLARLQHQPRVHPATAGR